MAGDSNDPFRAEVASVSTEEACLEQALVAHRSDLVRFLGKRLHCTWTARDIVQEVYFRIRRIKAGVRVNNPRALLLQIAANLATDHRRVESRRQELLGWARDLLWYADEEPSPERNALARSELEHIRAALLQLPERSRRVFYLNRFEGLTQQEISAQLGISHTEAEGSYFEARQGQPHLTIQPDHLYKLWTSYHFGAAGYQGSQFPLASMDNRKATAPEQSALTIRWRRRTHSQALRLA